MFYQLNYHRVPGWFYPTTIKETCRFISGTRLTGQRRDCVFASVRYHPGLLCPGLLSPGVRPWRSLPHDCYVTMQTPSAVRMW